MADEPMSVDVASAVFVLGTAADETTARYWLAQCARRGASQDMCARLWATWEREHRPTPTEVYCPFAGGPCNAAPDIDGNPTCPTPRDRVCVNGLPGEDDL